MVLALSSGAQSSTALPKQIQEALQFFQRPDIQNLLTDLQSSIFNFIINTSEELLPKEVRKLFIEAHAERKRPLVIGRCGAVAIIIGENDRCVGDIYLSKDSPMLRQEFMADRVSTNISRSVFQLRGVWHPVEQGHQSGFVLSDTLSLAAEIAMSMDYLRTYLQIAEKIATTERDCNADLLEKKVVANLRDSLSSASYLCSLEGRLSDLAKKPTYSHMWGKLSLPSGK